MTRPKPLLLLILDGFGYSDAQEHNAIAKAKTPHLDKLFDNRPNILISGSGEDVGLPEGQMGNSEVGHMNIGAGRVIPQDLVRINQAISNNELTKNPAVNALFDTLKQNNAALHIMGLVSDGGVHSHLTHIQAMVETAAAAGLKKIYIHAFLDGRDTPPQSARKYLQALDDTCKKVEVAKIVSLCGRFYAMDRDKRWDRTKAAFEMIVHGADFDAPNAYEALEAAYNRGETDEFVEPTMIHGEDEAPVLLQENDGFIFMNFRADRARQLTRALTEETFDGLARAPIPTLSGFLTLTQYADDIDASVIFPPLDVNNTFSDVISKAGLTQLRIAETEKYAHVTFFFSGGREEEVSGETRELIPSPTVKTYDLQPEMSVYKVTDHLIEAIEKQDVDVIICNFANPDMVGHTGNFDAAVKAIQAVDKCIGRIADALEKVSGEAIITADHGNAEQMYDAQTKQPHTAHTSELVPFIYIGRNAEFTQKTGVLADIAPTMLYLLGLDAPSDMTGKVLLKVD